jgi:DNA modification methylase
MKQISLFGDASNKEEDPIIEWDDSLGIKRGDIVELGPHRLMCGDSTSALDMVKLMYDGPADMVVTDPPYNVNYVGKDSDQQTIANDNLEEESFTRFLTDAFQNTDRNLKAGGAFYIFHASTTSEEFFRACKNTGWQIRQVLMWLKNSAAMSRQDYNWIHEPIIYGWKPGAPHKWRGSFSSTTVLYADKPTRSELHPTMKPVELYIQLMNNNSDKGDKVLDPFGGSGTLMIASHLTGRVGRLMELDPHYCEMIVKRFTRYTNIKPVLRVDNPQEV